MSAVTLIREAAKSGVWVGLNGGNLALKAPARPPDDLLDRLRRNKPEIVALLRQTACAIRPAGYSDVEWLAAVADAPARGVPAISAPSLSRHVFKTPRLAEFSSKKELSIFAPVLLM